MARIIIHRGTHPLEATAFWLAPRVAEVLRRKYGHEVELKTTRKPAVSGAVDVDGAYHDDDRTFNSYKIARETPDAAFVDFHNYFLEDENEKAVKAKILRKIREANKELRRAGRFKWRKKKLPVAFVMASGETVGFEDDLIAYAPANFYFLEIAAKAKGIPKNKGLSEDSPGKSVASALKSKGVGLMSEKLVNHVAEMIHLQIVRERNSEVSKS